MHLLESHMRADSSPSFLRKQRFRRLDIVVSGIAVALAGVFLGVVWLSPPLIFWPLFAVGVLRTQHLILHTDAHRALAKTAIGRATLEASTTIVTWMPKPLYTLHHIETHHRFLNSTDDWTGPYWATTCSFPDSPERAFRYLLRFPLRAVTGTIRSARNSKEYEFPLESKTSLAISLLATLLVIASAPDLVGSLIWLMSSVVMMLYLAGLANWLHHRNCIYEDSLSSSNTNVGLMSTDLGLNIGYHAAHHRFPKAHWSSLPRLHEKLLKEEALQESQASSVRSGLSLLTVRRRRFQNHQ